MKILSYPLKTSHKRIAPAAVSIGVFDGLHQGHLFLLKKLKYYSQKFQAKSVVVTFWPHPQKQTLIYSLSQRIELLKKIGIDVCIIVNFDSHLSNMSPQEFIEKVILKLVKPVCVIVGENFRFGKDAQADAKLLKSLSLKYNFDAKIIPSRKVSNRVISSSYIRRLISQGKISQANKFLFSPFTILGRVIQGQGLAKRLGFPTFNLNWGKQLLPKIGVYIVKVKFNNKTFKGICYIGNKPTFKKNNKKISFEVHLFDFSDNLKPKEIKVEFIERLRVQKKFSHPSLLIRQIKKDIQNTLHFFSIK